MTAFKLFDFQVEAADRISEAAQGWVDAYAQHGPLTLRRQPIPFLGMLKAVTGAGKTPVLARVLNDIGPAVVLWTSKSSAVVDQTYDNLMGRYHGLLPAGTRVIRQRPSRSEWSRLIGDTSGLTIWTTTVASWNEGDAAEKGGDEEARLNMHRPHPDWGGNDSPWEQLRTLARPLWVVYDESHNQTPTQLDQLGRLGPVGFLLASATPPSGELFSRWKEEVEADEIMAPIAEMARVAIKTADVVRAQLLKTALRVEDYQTEPETMLDALIARFKSLDKLAKKEHAAYEPKAIYVTERSNPPKGSKEMARPVAIWHYLRTKGIPAEQIAVYTQTKDLPEGAQRISALSALEPRHRHIIFNKALQEGWDDPAASLCYFDDETKSYTRIQQILGRVLRQPEARHAVNDGLNTATLYVRVTNKNYDEIIKKIKDELSLYATDDDDPFASSAIKLKTRKEPLDPVPVRRGLVGKLKVPSYVLGEADLDNEVKRVSARGKSPFHKDDLLSKGQLKVRTISLKGNEDQVRFAQIASGARTSNGEVLRRKIRRQSRACANLLHPDIYAGLAYEQRSCVGSVAQIELAALAGDVVEQYEQTVEFEPNPIKSEGIWRVPPHQPSSTDFKPFKHAAHAYYDRKAFNGDEWEFAQALDEFGKGTWTRNPSRGDGYGIPLPIKVGESSVFYADFIWWVRNTVYAIDPTGRHILEEKIRGKLLAIDNPKIVLITRGHIAKDWSRADETDGWTMSRAAKVGRTPAPERFDDLRDILAKLAQAA